ncbi:Glutathione S-transferase F13 [Acorus calamus]|uniref:Glutathione S-transferase F13 n=1 Tax=Acorus calamus TaxID=4465 RepID=A0AAV9F1J0_ACOCL|nr:Glutathione S-transferase F13 [Acorus calamus]
MPAFSRRQGHPPWLYVYERRLSKRKYLAEDFFISPKATLITSHSHVKAWWEDVSSRPVFKKVAVGMTLLS